MPAQDAIDIVRALRDSHADAFVYQSAGGPQVRLLEGTSEPYRIMVDAIGEGAVVLDASGIVLFANPAMGRLLSMRAEDLLGHGLGRYLSDAAAEELNDSFPTLMMGGTLDVEFRRGSDLVPVHLTARPIQFAGFECAIVIATDFSALQHLKNDLERRVVDRTVELTQANEALKDANVLISEATRHKSIFLANMSHELRTPLNAIIGFSELLLTGGDQPRDAPTQARFLKQILLGGQHLLGLINDILDLSKMEAGQMELRLQAVQIGLIVDEVISTVEPLVEQKGLRLATSVPDGMTITADAGKLKQMILNLVSNAIKFTPRGGTVNINAARTSESVEISVVDTGIGISDEDQVDLFKEFHQLENGQGVPQEGTGLGLALTERFAALHGGSVHLRSAVNRGSTFTIILPIKRASGLPRGEGDRVTPPVDAVDPTQPLVLIVEDDPGAAELIRRQLRTGGFRTHIERTGVGALTQARTLNPAAITLDILLPDMDGWEVITQLKREATTKTIPIVVVSVVDNPELGLALGAIDYFVKPVVAKELVKRLAQLVPQRDGTRPILVVDDDAANRKWFARVLKPTGNHVMLAAGGREGIQMAKAHRPALMLLDLMMPGVSGFDVIEALHSDPTTREMPIVVVTAARLTTAEKQYLNQRVSTILRRGSIGASDLLVQLRKSIGVQVAVA